MNYKYIDALRFSAAELRTESFTTILEICSIFPGWFHPVKEKKCS